MEPRAVFLIGAPRSGTTMLQLALSRHSQVVSPPETAFFTLLTRSRRGQHRHWQRIIKDLQVSLEPPPQRIRPGTDARRQFQRIATAYRDRIGKPGATRFLEKTPEHQRRIPLILRTFPEAKFVLIYRDGRDVALSLTRVPWMSRSLDLNFYLWLRYYRIQRSFQRREPQRVISVCYEDLVRDPAGELEPVLDFLGLDHEASVAHGSGNHDGVPEYELSFKGDALRPIHSGRICRWRNELTPREIGRLERWGGWALGELGYECVTDGRALLPPWHYPLVYGRGAAWLAARTIERKADDILGTSRYRPNRLVRSLPAPSENRASPESALSKEPLVVPHDQ